jgi:energy-coupling factor transporter ATP-binding protein EcfA2
MDDKLPKEIRDLVKFIQSRHIDHREYRKAREALLTYATFSEQGTILLLIGPSRAGKTRLARKVRTLLVDDQFDPAYRFSAWAEAVNPDRGRFSLKHLTLRLLTEMDHPIYRETDLLEAGKVYIPRRDATEPKLRLALEEAMRARRTRYLFLDEAHHVVQTNTPAHARNYLNSLKSLGNSTGVISIWISGYPIFDYGFSNTHLNGRIRIIHMRRYSDSPEDMDEFCAVLQALEAELPMKPGWSLLDAAWLLRKHTSGCIGNMMAWSQAALAEMVLAGSGRLQLSHFKKSRYSLQQNGVEAEIQDGERMLENVELIDDVRFLQSVKPKQKQSAPNRKTKCFQRKPKRDPVGKRA